MKESLPTLQPAWGSYLVWTEEGDRNFITFVWVLIELSWKTGAEFGDRMWPVRGMTNGS